MKRETEPRGACRLVTLARNEVAHVQCCRQGGAIALHLGPVTVRFDERALESVWSVLGQALARAHAEDEGHARGSYARAGQA